MQRYAVLGLGTFGRAVARSLSERGAEVVAIDLKMEIVEELKEAVSQAMCLDSTDERAMREAGLQDVDVAVVAHGESVEASILTTVIVRRLGVPTIVTRSMSHLHAEVLRAIGADRIVSVEEELGHRLAESLLAPEITEMIPLASGHSLAEIVPREEFVGKALREIDPRRKYGVNIVAIRRKRKEIAEGGEITYVQEIDNLPDPDSRIGRDDLILVVGADQAIREFGTGVKEKSAE